MTLTFRPVVWVTVEKASELTGRSVDSFKHLVHDGRLIEGTYARKPAGETIDAHIER